MEIRMKLKKPAARGKLLEQLEIQSMVLLAVVFLFIFAYIPMYGLQMAFREYHILRGLDGAAFVGLKYFKEFFIDINLVNVLRNTFFINLLGLAIGFPMPIVLALLLNELQSNTFKRVAQTISYLPHFLSWVIFGGLALEILSSNGLLNAILVNVGLLQRPVNFIGGADNFYVIINVLGVIKSVGYGSILYVAAISGIDQEMYEASYIDGCGRFMRMWHITLPMIMGTIVIMLIFQISAFMNTGVEHLFVLQNTMNISRSETLDTYVYKIGIGRSRFSYAAAVGLLKSAVSVLLLVGANAASKKLTDKGLF
jgi:putative aldouronate transport system permease protein